MNMVIPLALVLILAGLVMCWLCGSVASPLLKSVVYWTGVVLVVLGLVLLLAPVVVWLNAQLRAMFAL